MTPCSRLSETSVSMISCEVRVSRLPVGSSASSRLGALIKRASDGDALLLAAGELAGRIALALARPSRRKRRACPLDAHGAAASAPTRHSRAAARHSRWRWCGPGG